MLKLENVYKYYYSSSSVTCALRNINLDLKVGEFVAITGESGSGKTTLLNILSGLDTYEDGEMYYYDKKTSFFDNQDWENYRKDEIAFIFQNYNLIDSFTVLENVIVSYIISGYSYSEAKVKAKEILKLVGLENDTHKKATKLSGGQKQRLSIARALAKETNIIVADEPTGNLDAENGRNILELLKKVSKNKLVIIVTHNFSQIEPFITRKIRLHDGEILLDEKVENYSENTKEAVQDVYNGKDYKKIFNFSFLNIKSQPKKCTLLLLLIFIMVLTSFVFYGNFKSNLDINKTKVLDDSLFYNFDETRLLVKHSESLPITDELMKSAKVKDVVSVEKYDFVTDCNYYRPNDYKMNYMGGYKEDAFGNVQFVDKSFISLENETKFMRSYLSLNESDLKAGRLPVNNLEMVVYSDDDSILNKTELVFFKNKRKMGDDNYYQYSVKIVGILKERTEQAYFSEDLCQIMDMSKNTITISLFYSDKLGQYHINFNKICVDYASPENSLSFPEGIKNLLAFNTINETNNTRIKIYNDYHYFGYNFILDRASSSSIDALSVSKDVFDHLYSLYGDSEQFAIFINDYANTDDVMNKLTNKGFTSISCFRSSTTGYDEYKVVVRYINLVISLVALAVVNIVIILICYSILKVKKNDYVIFKMIGLSNNLIKKINYAELMFYGLVSNIILIITVSISKNYITNNILLEMLKHIRFYDYFIILLITIISMILFAKLFNKFLTSKTKITVLKEE